MSNDAPSRQTNAGEQRANAGEQRAETRQGLRRRRVLRVVALVAVVVGIALLAANPPPSSSPLDPRSTAPDGTKALAMLIAGLHEPVHLGRPTPGPGGVALVLQDQLSGSDRARLLSWVRHGNTLVVTDPTSPLAGVALARSTNETIGAGVEPLVVGAHCLLRALAGVGVERSGASLLRPVGGQVGCYPIDGGDLLIARHEAAGTVVVLGGPGMWLNANLGHADNSVLAANLLAPAGGKGTTIVGASRIGGGHQGLVALIPPRVKELFWQLAIAFALLALWRAVRLGKPVPEPLPVDLAGSEFVVATGHLLHEAGQRRWAVDILRGHLRRSLSDRLGLDPGAPAETLASVAADRAGVDSDGVLAALAGPSPANDRDLVALAQEVEAIRQDVNHAR